MPVPELLCAEPAELGAVFCDGGGAAADGETGFVEFGLLEGEALRF